MEQKYATMCLIGLGTEIISLKFERVQKSWFVK